MRNTNNRPTSGRSPSMRSSMVGIPSAAIASEAGTPLVSIASVNDPTYPRTSRIAWAMANACCSATSRRGASTMTRASGSVPE